MARGAAAACRRGRALWRWPCSGRLQLLLSARLHVCEKGRQSARPGRLVRRLPPRRGPEPPAEGDLAIARAAASEVLTRGGKDASLPWENPQTGARGTVTPLASAYTQDGFICRDFLASYVKNGSEIVDAGRGLPRRTRQVGSAQSAALEALPEARDCQESQTSAGSLAMARCIVAVGGGAPHIATVWAGHCPSMSEWQTCLGGIDDARPL